MLMQSGWRLADDYDSYFEFIRVANLSYLLYRANIIWTVAQQHITEDLPHVLRWQERDSKGETIEVSAPCNFELLRELNFI